MNKGNILQLAVMLVIILLVIYTIKKDAEDNNIFHNRADIVFENIKTSCNETYIEQDDKQDCIYVRYNRYLEQPKTGKAINAQSYNEHSEHFFDEDLNITETKIINDPSYEVMNPKYMIENCHQKGGKIRAKIGEFACIDNEWL